jgi:hypothetical protein
MRKVLGVVVCVGSLLLLISATAFAGHIEGDYVETRSADVYTGPCFANGEVGLTGNQAIIAWKVRRGDWKGVPLEGLSVVAVTRAKATLGDVYSDPYPARSILILDRNATADQRAALVDMARAMGGRLLEDVVRIETAPISMQVGEGDHHGSVQLKAGGIASVETRSLGDKDHFCGNEVTYYPPLTELHHAMPAFAISSTYSGDSLDTEWRIFGKRSAFVGTFER